jgi:hypothetical protein
MLRCMETQTPLADTSERGGFGAGPCAAAILRMRGVLFDTMEMSFSWSDHLAKWVDGDGDV